MEETIKIGGELESTATGNVVAAASAIKDKAKGKYQSQINAETDQTLAEHGAGIRALNSQNYVTVSDYASLPQSGQSADTVYRVSNYDGALSAVDSTKYSEYAWNGAQYLLLSVKSAIEEVFDVSEYNASGGSYATYTDLADLLANHLADIPPARRKGGMSVKFIQTSDNKYMQYRCIANEFTTDTTQWAICDAGVYIENPEFIGVYTDSEDNILWAIKTDGTILYGAGVPQQIIDYINEKIAELSLDEYEDIVTFLGNLIEGDTLAILLNNKVDKATGKSLIDAEYATGISYIENEEFAIVYFDYNERILFGVKTDGDFYFGYGVPNQIVEYVNNQKAEILAEIQAKLTTALDTKVDKVEGKGLSTNDYIDKDKELVTINDIVDNPEYIEAKTDSEDKLIAGRTPDGAAFENVGFSTPKVSIDGHIVENIEDPEERIEIKTDSEGKVICYRKEDGTKVENVGIETSTIMIEEKLVLGGEAQEQFNSNVKGVIDDNPDIPEVKLPKYGVANMVSETFYLVAAGWSDYATEVELRQDYPDTAENAHNKVTLSNFYIVGTNTKLDFYAASKVTKVGDKYYVTSSLTEIEDPETHEISYEVNAESIEVRQCTDVPPYKAWPVDKKTEHYCVVQIDFGHYLNGTFCCGVKYQGSSTLLNRKRNFRFTFYKNSSYAKKNKIKIGEMLRLSGFNLKCNAGDDSKVKELVMNRLFIMMWENRGNYQSYPWEGIYPYSGATGMIKGFPIRLNIGGGFYGIMVFGLKKDEKNYMLEDDASGMFVSGTVNSNDCWTDAVTYLNNGGWEDEMNDELTQSNIDALTVFFNFINSTDFTKENMPERMSVIDWIDYFLGLQIFNMKDNTCRNLILYSDSEKKKMYPFMYDLDLSMQGNINEDIMTFSLAGDMSLWEHFTDAYWDEIVNRYVELRNTVLKEGIIKSVYKDAIADIPDSDYSEEKSKWGSGNKDYTETLFEGWLIPRLKWIDENYFKI